MHHQEHMNLSRQFCQRSLDRVEGGRKKTCFPHMRKLLGAGKAGVQKTQGSVAQWWEVRYYLWAGPHESSLGTELLEQKSPFYCCYQLYQNHFLWGCQDLCHCPPYCHFGITNIAWARRNMQSLTAACHYQSDMKKNPFSLSPAF